MLPREQEVGMLFVKQSGHGQLPATTCGGLVVRYGITIKGSCLPMLKLQSFLLSWHLANTVAL